MGPCVRRDDVRMDFGFAVKQLARNDVDMTPRSRDVTRPRFASSFVPPRNRGRREDRVLAAPAVSRAICATKTAHEHTGQLEHSGLPCAMALRLTSCSPRRAGLVVTVVGGIASANLTPASGRQDHTTSPYAQAAHVSRSSRVHRISPHVRDDGQRPSTGETGGVMPMIWSAS